MTRASQSSPPSRKQGGVQVITRVAAILRAIASAPTGLSIAELARTVDLPRSTVYRIVATLADDGFVNIGPGRQGVQLGPELGQLAAAAWRGLAEAAHPFMERMARAVGETVDLAVLQHGQVRFVDQVVGNQRLRTEVVVGELYPAYCTANGKAMLAALSPAALEAALRSIRLVRLTPHTIVKKAKLLEDLETVRRTQVAFDREEHTPQICAVGTVIHDPLGGMAGAITIAAPANRFYGREDELVKTILDGKEGIEDAMGSGQA